MNDKPGQVSVLIPTYNEADNIVPLLDQLCVTLADRDFQIIVVDDNSPDGTYDLVQRRAAADGRIQGIKRPGKLGLGSAVLEGFRASTGDTIVMMDGDLSHRPQDLLLLLGAAGEADIVVGSRYLAGGHIQGWPPWRHLASQVAILTARALLSPPVKDVTSGFALFRREVLESAAPRLNPTGFKLLLEVLVQSPKARVREVPITFVNRSRGKSKFGPGEALIFLRLCLALRRQRRSNSASAK